MDVNQLIGTCSWTYTPEHTWFAELTNYTPDDVDTIREKITQIIENLDREITDEERALFAFSYKTTLRRLRTKLDLVKTYNPGLKKGDGACGAECSMDICNDQELTPGRMQDNA